MSVENASKWERPTPLWYSQSWSNLILQQQGENKNIQSQLSSAQRQDNLRETFYGVSLEEKCISLSWKKHLVDLENKSIHEKYEQKFSLFLKPSLQRDKKFHPPLQRHNAKLPSNRSFMVDHHGDWCKQNHKSHYPAKYWVWVRKGAKELLFRLKEIIWNGEWQDFSQSKLSWVRL